MAASPPLETDPRTLRAKLRALEAARATGLDDVRLEALAEACFRIALHPGTAPVEAIQLLQRAAACDPANPKPAYHLARLYFVHDELGMAGQWLQRAFLLCPTSHRIWVHVSLLQRELSRRRRRDKDHDADALRQRSLAVLEQLRAGADEIDASLLDLRPPPIPTSDEPVPPPAPVPAPTLRPVRIVDAGVCRWTGIDDLEAEERLLADPTEAGRDELAQSLELAARRAAARPGGAAAFVVMAVAFLVGGYPVATVQRTARLLGDRQTPSLELLELVCGLYRTDESELPARLGEALAADRIPPQLAAIIHHHRLLWRPLRFSTLGPAYRAVRRFLDTGAEPDDQFLEVLEQGLRSAESELDAEPPEPMPDMPVGPGAEVADLQGRLELLQQEAERLRRQVPWLKKLVGGGRPLDGSDRDQVLAIAAAVQGIDSDCDAALKMLVSIKERGAHGVAVAELGTLEAGLQDIGTGALPRLLPKAMRLVEPAASEAGADGGGSGRERLQRALEHIDARVDERCRDAEATFAAYPADVWRLPEMRALRILVRDGAAETRYRFGDLPAARHGWIMVRRDDRLRMAAAKNLAVAATLGGDGRQMAWWRAYAEGLYESAIMARSLRPQATVRADLHRDLGGAWAPARLAADDPEDRAPLDDLACAVFLSSAGRVRLFVRHRLLEHLNRKLDFASPTLLLGVARDEDDQIRGQARDRLLDLVVLACASLPVSVRSGFREIAAARVRGAYHACQQASSRTLSLDGSYEEEQARQLDWLRSVSLLRLNLVDLVWRHREELDTGLESAAVLDELVLLDMLPVANSPRYLEEIRHELRRDEELLREPMQRLRDEVLDLARGTWAIGPRARRRKPPDRSP